MPQRDATPGTPGAKLLDIWFSIRPLLDVLIRYRQDYQYFGKRRALIIFHSAKCHSAL
jgi:hypothetical protein